MIFYCCCYSQTRTLLLTMLLHVWPGVVVDQSQHPVASNKDDRGHRKNPVGEQAEQRKAPTGGGGYARDWQGHPIFQNKRNIYLILGPEICHSKPTDLLVLVCVKCAFLCISWVNFGQV